MRTGVRPRPPHTAPKADQRANAADGDRAALKVLITGNPHPDSRTKPGCQLRRGRLTMPRMTEQTGTDTAPPDLLPAGPVRLVRWRDSDVDAVYEAVTSSLTHLLPWAVWARGYDHSAAASFIAACGRDWAAGTAYNYAIHTRGTDNPSADTADAVAGSCSLMRNAARPERAAVGYWLRPDHLGRGFATAAAAALTAAAFELPGINLVEIWHDAANHRSAAIPRRLGFTQAGQVPTTGPHAPACTGISLVWQLRRPAHTAAQPPNH
jgi:RimJ/RimL family protein N-acetyltransferase